MALVSCSQECEGKCWVRAHLCGKKREVLVQRSRICSKITVVRGIQCVLGVDRLVLEFSGKEGCQRQKAFGTIALCEQCVVL